MNTLTIAFILNLIQLIFGLSNTDYICSQFTSGKNVLNSSFGYQIPVNNTINENTYITYARTDKNGEITMLQIVDKESISSTISCLHYLVELRIIRTESFNLKDFPQSLRILYLSHIDMSNHSKDLHQFINLEKLTIIYTNLQSLFWIGSLHRLTHFILHHNNLHSLSSSIIQLISLKYLDISFNPRLNSLNMINNHQQLEYIIASSCSIKNLPQNLPNLIRLQIDNNLLTSLDNIETLGNKTKVEKFFFFQNNQIKYLNRLQQIQNINTINVNNNKIQTIPWLMLCKSKQFKKILLKQNPVSNLIGYKFNVDLPRQCFPKIEFN